MPSQPTAAYHERSLRRALDHLDRALAALDDADGTLADAGVQEHERLPIAGAQMQGFEAQNWIKAQLQQSAQHAAAQDPEATISEDQVQSDRAPAAPQPPPPREAIELLFGSAGEAELEAEYGHVVDARLVEVRGADAVTVTAGRLTVREGMTLVGRLVDSGGRPWRIGLACLAAAALDDTSRLELVVTSVTTDEQRGAPRVGIDASVALTAVACAKLHEGDELHGQIVDLSTTGIAFSAPDPLQLGDRVRFRARFVEGTLEGEARVASIRVGRSSFVIGCWFTQLGPETAGAIERLLDRRDRQAEPVSYRGLRALFDDPSDAPAPSQTRARAVRAWRGDPSPSGA